jgi:hypothetical protein
MIPQGGGSIILVASMSANVCLPFRRSHLLHKSCLSDRQRTAGEPHALTNPRLFEFRCREAANPIQWVESRYSITFRIGPISEDTDRLQP